MYIYSLSLSTPPVPVPEGCKKLYTQILSFNFEISMDFKRLQSIQLSNYNRGRVPKSVGNSTIMPRLPVLCFFSCLWLCLAFALPLPARPFPPSHRPRTTIRSAAPNRCCFTCLFATRCILVEFPEQKVPLLFPDNCLL